MNRDMMILGRFYLDFTTTHCFTYTTVLKTIIRANPGIVLLSDGVVQGKWHYNDTPSADDLQQRLNSGLAVAQ
ncbi:hypothetical protein [Tunicatimonas pelagia]|uniref:hypothetical protein n=1 Tax=Tunicatimonas pelagia TaxID=931531 RepID=UPI0026655C7B|nr:hypothetical protein [Tunicatimonas pelagia]WKN46407.1 hypothetical protein P0M28_22065 [Tunicatimonas pelagia]